MVHAKNSRTEPTEKSLKGFDEHFETYLCFPHASVSVTFVPMRCGFR